MDTFGQSGWGKISSSHFTIGAKNKNLVEQSRIGMLVVRFSQTETLKKHVPLVFKGTNGRQKTYEIFHVYCIFYSGFMCQTTAIFGITKDGSLESNILAS